MDGGGRVTPDTGVGEADGVANARVRKRDSLFMTAALQLPDAPGAQEVRVRNLSSGGLMVELDRVVAPGTVVTLQMRGLGELTGSVAWCTRGRVGIALDQPIDPKLARKPVGNGTTTPIYAKPLIARVPRKR